MSTSSIFDMSLSGIWDSFNTPAYWIGFLSVCFLILLFLLAFCWYLLVQRRRLLTISSDAQGGEFKISLRAVKAHLKNYLSKRYPRLRLRKVGLRGYKRGVKASVYVQVMYGENMQTLREHIMSDLQKTLNDQMGMEDLFTGVDVIVSDMLGDAEDAVGASESEELPASGRSEVVSPSSSQSKDSKTSQVKPSASGSVSLSPSDNVKPSASAGASVSEGASKLRLSISDAPQRSPAFESPSLADDSTPRSGSEKGSVASLKLQQDVSTPGEKSVL